MTILSDLELQQIAGGHCNNPTLTPSGVVGCNLEYWWLQTLSNGVSSVVQALLGLPTVNL
jgi:hypothetical protein